MNHNGLDVQQDIGAIVFVGRLKLDSKRMSLVHA